MKYLRLLVLLPLAFILFGCPYSSSVPITEANEAYPVEILGKWQDADADSTSFYEVKKLSETIMQVIENTWNETDESWDKSDYLAHTSDVDGDLFLNVNQDGTYYFYKIVSVSDTEAELWPLTEYIKEEFTESEALKAFVAEHKDLGFFYGEPVSYIKLK